MRQQRSMAAQQLLRSRNLEQPSEKLHQLRGLHSQHRSLQQRKGWSRREGALRQSLKPWKLSRRMQDFHRLALDQRRLRMQSQRLQKLARQRSQKRRRRLLQRSASLRGSARLPLRRLYN